MPWEIIKEEKKTFLYKEIQEKSYYKLMAITNAIGLLAQQKGHHPDLLLSFGKLSIKITTHDQGFIVTQKDQDFAMAIDKLLEVF